MTMLDRMRRHKGWLKWSLALVVFAFILFYIPAFLGRGDSGAGGAGSDMVARVDGRTITVLRFPARLPGPDPGVPRRVRREHQRADAEAAGHRPADSPADGRRGSVAGRSEASRHRRVRRRARAAHPLHPGVQRERPVHRPGALRRAAADAAAAADGRSVRAEPAQEPDRREAPVGRHRVGHASPGRTSTRSSSAATTR